jgi:tetratricopeptide (TPR) repeat protein
MSSFIEEYQVAEEIYTVKLILMRAVIISFLFLTAASSMVSAETKTFIKEYTYHASDFDSKMTSRAIALEQVKRLLLEEVGTYLSSETDIKNFQLTRDKITTLSAGVVQTEIIAERWDGLTYAMKAKISLDPQEVIKLIEGLKNNAQKSKELEETNRKIDEVLRKIRELQNDNAAGRPAIARQTEYSKAVTELNAKEWMDKGVALMTIEKYPAALDAFARATEIDPSNAWTHINRGWAMNSIGDYQQAVKEFNIAADIDPKNAWIYVHRGLAYNGLGDFRQGIIDADKAINLDGTIPFGYISRGWAYVGLGNYRQAVAELDRAAQLEPRNPFIYTTRMWAHNALGNARQANEDLDKSIELAPNNSFMQYGAATFYVLANQKERALEALGRSIQFNSTLKQRVKMDKNFQSLWNDDAFRKMAE